MSGQKLTPWERIIDAAEHGHGIRLSTAECEWLAQDDAIVQRALVMSERREKNLPLADEDQP